jgi:hypothetical protein
MPFKLLHCTDADLDRPIYRIERLPVFCKLLGGHMALSSPTRWDDRWEAPFFGLRRIGTTRHKFFLEISSGVLSSPAGLHLRIRIPCGVRIRGYGSTRTTSIGFLIPKAFGFPALLGT